MSLSVGIVGLPNVGKSTLFNALLKKQQALAANYPFATIEPNVGMVSVYDERLEKLAEVVKKSEKMDSKPPMVPAVVKFVDIAGLVAGAHKGEGLGNKFLAHIREVDLVCHVLRAFEDDDVVREGSKDPRSDFETVEAELMLADLATLEKQKEPKGLVGKEEKLRWQAVEKFRQMLNSDKPLRKQGLTEFEAKVAADLCLLSFKPVLVVVNVGEGELEKVAGVEREAAKMLGESAENVVGICAKLEAELVDMPEEERGEYLQAYGLKLSGLERLAKRAYNRLGLLTFFTAGEKEVRVWTVTEGMKAREASGVIHTDFAKNFIKANVIGWEKLVEIGGWKLARERGLVRSEGGDYVMDDGDVVEFMVGV